MTTLELLLTLGGIYLVLSLICGVAWAIAGYRWNTVKYRAPLREEDYALYAEPTWRTR